MRELKRYKEELVAVLLLSLVMLTVRWLSVHYWSTGRPDDMPVQYDLRSETETIAWVALRMVIYSLIAWLGLRLTMPSAYDYLKRRFEFSTLSNEQKLQTSMRLFAIFFFGLVALHMSGAPTTRECVISSARADLQVRELTGNNDGPRIAEYQRHVKAPLRSSWCVAFVSYHLSACGVTNPKSAWSPAYSSTNDRVWTPRKALRDPLPADVFTLYYPHLGRVGHGGFVVAKEGRYIRTLEGNTSGGGSREGDGVYERRRELSKVYAITNYIHDDATPSTSARQPRPVGDDGLQASKGTHPHHGAARQRGGALRTKGHRDLDRQGQCQRPGGTASAWARPASCVQDTERSDGNAEREQRRGAGQLRVRQHGLQAPPLGQVDARDQLAEGHIEGGDHRDRGALVVLVAARRSRPVRAMAPAQGGAAHHQSLASLTSIAA